MLMLRPAAFAAVGLSLVLAQGAQATIISTMEGAGVQSSTASNTTSINFDSQGNGYTNSETFNPTGSLTATYSGNQFIKSANEYGGAGGTGNYFSVQANNSVSMALSTSQAYFGLWVSAGDYANKLEFYKGDHLVGSFSAIGASMAALPDSYLGNPNAAFLNENPTEKYAFVNFYAQTADDMFDRIVFTNLNGGTEFESDNHTFSSTLQAPSAAVPEPTSLASGAIGMMILSGLWIRRKGRASASL